MRNLNRREAILGLFGAGVSLAACGKKTEPTPTEAPVPTPTVLPTATRTPDAVTIIQAQQTEIDALKARLTTIPSPVADARTTTPTVKADVVASTPTIVEKVKRLKDVGGVMVSGEIPEKVDLKVVNVAREPFKTSGRFPNTFAEPGGLLVGPDFGSKSSKNPFGVNSDGWDKMYTSEGSIQPFSAVTQEVYRSEGPVYAEIPGNGFTKLSAGKAHIAIVEGDPTDPEAKVLAEFDLPPEKGLNHFFVVRGRYGDHQQDTDENLTARITGFVPGHAEAEIYQARYAAVGDNSNLAFISEGQFDQQVATVARGASNCGVEGCSRLRVTTYDSNTGALDVMEHTQGRGKTFSEAIDMARKNWSLKYSNWRAK